MKVLTTRQHRALAFVEACNRGGHSPSGGEVIIWLDDESGRKGRWRSSLSNYPGPLSELMGSRIGIPDDSDALVALGWLSASHQGLQLTRLGKALLRSATQLEESSSVNAVVLNREDPVAYPRLIGHLAGLGPDGLIVDPYLGIDELHHVVASTEVAKVLIKKGREKSKEIRASIDSYLGMIPETRTIEVRASSDSDVHDRFLVSPEGVQALGHSLNAIAAGSGSTLLIALPEPAASAQRDRILRWWNEAEMVAPVRNDEPPPAR